MLIADGYYQQKKEDFETLSYVIAVGYASAKKGKMIPLFKNEEKQKVKKISKEEKDRKTKELFDLFKEAE